MGLKLSPVLFNLYYALNFKKFVKKYDKNMIMLLYADDTILVIERDKCNIILDEFLTTCKNINFKINKKKSEILYNKEIDFNTAQIIIDIKKKYEFELKLNARYLGKWIGVNEKGKIIEGEDEIKTI